ncbi:MAG: TonB-dependent receptor plug domain-containing protein [Acidobacteriota bacterium]
MPKQRCDRRQQPWLILMLFTVVLLCLLPADAHAQQDEARAEEQERPLETLEDEIIVKASRTELPASSTPASVVLIDEEAVEANTVIADELASVLSREVPGFAPSIQKLTGRGETLRGRNPLYLIDGVNQHNALRDGSRDGHTIDLAFVERIEVINGSNAIQGVGATGGVINVLTREPSLGTGWQSSVDLRLNGSSDFDSDSVGYKVSGLTGGSGERFGPMMSPWVG